MTQVEPELSQLFAPAPPKEFGTVGPNGRYHMPLLPGEKGTQSGGDWVPRGLMRVTNLVGAFEDTRALNVWEQAMGLIGLALSPELYEELVLIVQQAQRAEVVFEKLREYPALREVLAGQAHDKAKLDASIIGRAKAIAKANAAAQRGTNRHTGWEHRGKTGELIGTPEIQQSTLNTEKLLADAGYVRVPHLSERVVRNTEVGAVGKFDDILMHIRTGVLKMADLKTKATPFFSWLTTDAQLATYAKSRWMLTEDRRSYEDGPLEYVDQKRGVILHVPSDGSPAHLDEADLETGWEVAQTARRVIELRSGGKSSARHAMGNCHAEVKDLDVAS